MTREELIALAKEKAGEHNLYPELVCAMCEQESSWNPWAVRYEPAFYERYVRPLLDCGKMEAPRGISLQTEATARSIS